MSTTNPIKLEAVTVSVGYSDFLFETAKLNRCLLDDWVVVTKPDDIGTREVCRRFNIRCVLSDDGTQGKDFAKGVLIERGLQHLSADGWRIHLDADIALPADFRLRLRAAHLQPDMIYGADRLMVKNWTQWQKLLATGYLQHGMYDYHCRVNINALGLELGTRWAHPQFGVCPIGYFQIWHSAADQWRGIRIKPYPANHNSACRTDVQFSFLWDRHKRGWIPELMVAHLESQKAKSGANWQGRTTIPFGPQGATILSGKTDAPTNLGSS